MPKIIYEPLDRLDPMFKEAPTRYAPNPPKPQAAKPELKSDKGKAKSPDHQAGTLPVLEANKKR